MVVVVTMELLTVVMVVTAPVGACPSVWLSVISASKKKKATAKPEHRQYMM